MKCHLWDDIGTISHSIIFLLGGGGGGLWVKFWKGMDKL